MGDTGVAAMLLGVDAERLNANRVPIRNPSLFIISEAATIRSIQIKHPLTSEAFEVRHSSH
jgi:hypothetical protein